MKKIFTLIISISLVVFAQAQTLKLFDELDADITNQEIYSTGTPSDNVIYSHVKVKNTNMFFAVDVKVRKNVISEIGGTVNTFCWGECFAPFVQESPSPISINFNSTDETSFAGEYEPLENNGVTTIEYTFFLSNNPTDAVKLTVHYSAYPLTNGMMANSDKIGVWPNPASSSVRVNVGKRDYSVIEIYSILGGKVGEWTLSDSEAIDISAISKGVYIYNIVTEGKVVKTDRLVISK